MLILKLMLVQYSQYSGMAFLEMIIVPSMLIISYRPAYSKYLFILNLALLTVIGFLISALTFIIPYVVTPVISITLYLLMIRMLELYPLILFLNS